MRGWSQKSISEIVSYYHQDAILILNKQIFRGPKEIALAYAQTMALSKKGSSRSEEVVIKGRVIYFTWYLKVHHDNEYYGNVTFVVENGKVTIHTVSSQIFNKYPIALPQKQE